MKRKANFFGITLIIAITALVTLLLAGCPGNPPENPGGDDPPPPENPWPPTMNEFSTANFLQNEGNVTAVTITPRFVDLDGDITVYYDGSPTLPTAAGTYPVTFDIAASSGWKAATGLFAGKLRIYPANYHILKSIKSLSTLIYDLPVNTANEPHYIVMEISDFGGLNKSGNSNAYDSLGFWLVQGNRYVNLDLSGSSVKTIPEDAFNGVKLTGLTLPDGLAEFNNFGGCTSLTEINIDSDNGAFTTENGILYNKDKTVLLAYPAGKADTSFTIPNSVTGIARLAFSACTNLAVVTLPSNSGFTNIGNGAFSNCISLKSITIPNNITSIGEDAFFFSGIESIIIPDSVTGIGRDAFNFCKSLESAVIGNGITSIEESTFFNCNKLTSVTIGNKVAVIGESVFFNCGIQSITIPDSVTSIGVSAFGRNALTSITIPENVTSIGARAFEDCWELISVTFLCDIPDLNVNPSPFVGNLWSMYSYYGKGTYTKDFPGSTVWNKQP